MSSMHADLGRWLASSLLMCWCAWSTVAVAEPSIDQLIGDVADYWSPVIADSGLEQPLDLPTAGPGQVTPVQMLAPQSSPRVAQRQRRSSAAAADTSGLSDVPFMIGDTGAGTCLSFGGLVDVDLGHPTLTCSRLNISENNSPLPTDRLYASYRHFHNASNFRYFQFGRDYNLDRVTFGGERTFFDRMLSFELRVPLENRISSDVFSYDVFDPPLFLPDPPFSPDFIPFGGGKRTEFGNVSMVLKALLRQTSTFALSAGLGTTLPTAQDVTYLITTDNPVVFPGIPGFADSAALLDVYASNETVYLSPFLAWLYQPQQRFFHQGFLQVEVPANPSDITIAGSGAADFTNGDFLIYSISDPLLPTQRLPLHAQTLLRLNLGWGYILHQDRCASFLNQLTALFEMHYTTTLNDANITSVSVFPVSVIGTPPIPTIDFGNLNNHADVLNTVMGLSASLGSWVVTNGVTVPIRDGSDRAFDFEYNLQIQRIF